MDNGKQMKHNWDMVSASSEKARVSKGKTGDNVKSWHKNVELLSKLGDTE